MSAEIEQASAVVDGPETEPVDTGLQYRAVLTCVSIHQWGARKASKGLAAGLAFDTEASDEAYAVTKRLVDSEHTKPMRDVYKAARETWLFNSVAWSEEWRLMPAGNLERFTQGMIDLERQFNEAVGEFVEKFEGLVKLGVKHLGTSFDPDDYPDPRELRRHYSFIWRVSPVPETGDIRVQVSGEVAARLRAQGRKAAQDAASKSSLDLIERMLDVARRAQSAFDLTDDGRAKPIKGALLRDMQHVATSFDALNVVGDPKVARAIESFRAAFSGIDADGLRADKAARAAHHQKAGGVVDELVALL